MNQYPYEEEIWEGTEGATVYNAIGALTSIRYDLPRDTIRQVAYRAGEIAFREQHENCDNFRVMRIKEPNNKYWKKYHKGCCGECDIVVNVSAYFDNELFLVGWNYGH